MAINPFGAVWIQDFGTPQTFTAYASEAVSGGELAMCSGAEDLVSSGLNSFASADISILNGASGAKFNGIILANTASGAAVAVASNGVFILRCDGSVLAGEPVECAGNEAVKTLGSLAIPAALYDASMASRKIGRALTAGASGNFAIAYFTG